MINDVYSLVQTILNKNRFGEITPTRFNLFAKSAQIKIIDEALDDLRRGKTAQRRDRGSDDLQAKKEILDDIITREYLTRKPAAVLNDYFTLPDDFMYEESLWLNETTPITIVSKKKIGLYRGSYTTPPTKEEPIAEKFQNKLYIYPDTIGKIGTYPVDDDVLLYYYALPTDPKWTYTEVSGLAVFNPSAGDYQDFVVPEYYFHRMVVDILAQAAPQLRQDQIAAYVQAESQEQFNRDNV